MGLPATRHRSLSASDNEGINLLSTNDVSVHLDAQCCHPCFAWWVSSSSMGGTSGRNPAARSSHVDVKPVHLKTTCPLSGCYDAAGLLPLFPSTCERPEDTSRMIAMQSLPALIGTHSARPDLPNSMENSLSLSLTHSLYPRSRA